MKRYAFGLVLAALALAPVTSRAQTTSYVYVFSTVDAVTVESWNSRLVVRGILQGEAAAVDRFFSFTGTYGTTGAAVETCARMALLAMERPGEYTFQVDASTSGYPKCKLARASL